MNELLECAGPCAYNAHCDYRAREEYRLHLRLSTKKISLSDWVSHRMHSYIIRWTEV